MITTITDVDVTGKRVLTRVDFNVPQDENGRITDDTRIVETIPTLRAITERGGIAVVMSHLGRPKGSPQPKYSLRPIANHLAEVVGGPVHFAEDCIGPVAEAAVAAAQPGSIVVLENLRFYADEEQNDTTFAAALAKLGDIYCNDAFGTAHRAHASTAGVAAFLPVRCAGLLMQKELDYLGRALAEPKRPLVAVLGGSKISGKIDVIRALMDSCDTILVGGGMMFTFLVAQGKNVGASLVEEDRLNMARELLAEAERRGVRLLIPSDTIAADRFAADAATKTVKVTDIEPGWMGLDIGPNTAATFVEVIHSAGTVVWNGPMGVFEFPAFSHGTLAIAHALVAATEKGAITIVGGGDSAAAITQFGLAQRVTHVSTGGGASLEFLEGKVLPGVAALELT